jgi:hypothetical protein
MCWPGYLDTFNNLSGVGKKNLLKFSYVLARWEGSAHDATVLADAIEREDGFTIPQVIALINY